MRLNALILLCVFALASCGEKQEAAVPAVEEPADLIPEDKLIQVIADVHLLESAVSLKEPYGARQQLSLAPNSPPQPMPSAPHPAEQKLFPYYDIFAKYGYTRDQYERSLQWYSMDPEHFSEIYDEVIVELTRRQAEAQQKSPRPPGNDTID